MDFLLVQQLEGLQKQISEIIDLLATQNELLIELKKLLPPPPDTATGSPDD